MTQSKAQVKNLGHPESVVFSAVHYPVIYYIVVWMVFMVHGGFKIKRCSVVSLFKVLQNRFSIWAIIRFLGTDAKMCADMGDYKGLKINKDSIYGRLR